MGPIIQVRNLSKRFDDFLAVDHISFSVKRGELFAFLGTNGAGKSTTINMICTILTKTSGDIFVDGFEVAQAGEQIRKN